MDLFLLVSTVLAIIFLVNSCIEVGSNDAANLVNAVYGSKALQRNTAVVLAGVFVVLGASFSSPVMNTVRKGIFDVSQFDAYMSVSVFIAAYFVSITLLYIYSLFGMPVSTTATLVFCLAGGATGVVQNSSAVNWPQFFQVIFAIVASIVISGFIAYIAQRVFRYFIGEECTNTERIFKHGSWIASLMLVALIWFLLAKGMKHVSVVHNFHEKMNSQRFISSMLIAWLSFTVIIRVLIKIFGKQFSDHLFRIVSVLGMVSMAFAFGQNDLANCASPGIAIFMIWSQGLAGSLKMNVPVWSLALCGFLMFLGMMTQRARRVSMAEIKTGSKHDNVVLYAPKWCLKLASMLLQIFNSIDSKSEPQKTPEITENHYDGLRASVILSVSACVIAFASSQGLPVSTTYVAFAAVIASGWGDKVFAGGQAELKVGRTIWVISGWFLGALGAFVASCFTTLIIYQTGAIGIATCLGIFIYFKSVAKSKGENHALKYDQTLSEESISLSEAIPAGNQGN